MTPLSHLTASRELARSYQPGAPGWYDRAMLLVSARLVTERRFRRARFWAFALLGFVVGHDAVFRAEYGAMSSRALAVTGQGYWLGFALLAALVAAAPILAGLGGIVRLQASIGQLRAAVAVGPQRPTVRRVVADRPPAPVRTWRAEFAQVLPRLTAATFVGFLLQENAQFLAAGHAMPGLAVIVWPYHPWAVPVLCAVSALVSAAAAWIRWRGEVLASMLRATRAQVARLRAALRPAPARWRILAAAVANEWLLARRLAGRAPPLAARA